MKTNTTLFVRYMACFLLVGQATVFAESMVVVDPEPVQYQDGRPAARYRLDATDHGVVLRYGDGPNGCDRLGARDAWVFEQEGTYYMHYDAAGPTGWLCSLATSKDLLQWKKHGPVLDFGKPGADDSASASYGVTYRQGDQWHMFYLGTPNTSPAPDLVPSFPYLTMKATSDSPTGPWSVSRPATRRPARRRRRFQTVRSTESLRRAREAAPALLE